MISIQLAYHEYHSLASEEGEHGSALVEDFGDKMVVFLRNGFITCGKTIPEAMFYCHHLEQACRRQLAALSWQSRARYAK